MAKGKGGTGRGTDSKGWNRWKASENRAKSAPKPYKSKGLKAAAIAAKAAGTSNTSNTSSTASTKSTKA
ncbi:hypothetical protein PAECIP111891_07095 [Paenibacillus allorhizoplanae]|uniref:DUF3934 domain-containing protein n=1 Tax=Paenibacillus allorhizoplanae TaxID=2905648 RepID=A0ABN8H9C5_9BACL|nr:DUF3934 family protein [Paenibacillus allorhizoplanae]CAH1232760.1 hypothetical protein PAECIP111891_07095 [Paenibacillus allorhizoplanae]